MRKQQRRTQASSQQVARLERELADVVKEAELHNQRRVQAEDKAAALQLELDSAPATARDDSILLQNLRNELAAQSADIATARRLKEKIRYWLHSLCQAVHTCQSIAKTANPLPAWAACALTQYPVSEVQNVPHAQGLWLGHSNSVCCYRNTEVLQEQLHAASTRAEMAEQRAAEADGLILQLTQLQSHQQMWDKMLQVQHAQVPQP